MSTPIQQPRPAPDAVDLHAPQWYLNRELSQLAFNRRVFEQAADPAVPVLERLRFLCITSSNLDEFFEIRVAGLKQQAQYGAVQGGADNLTPVEVLRRISDAAHQLVADQYRFLNEQLLPALDAEGIRFLRREDWTAQQQAWLAAYFRDEVLPVITPIRLDPAHPFPRILNKRLNFIVSLEGKDAFGNRDGLAIVPAPRVLPRVIRLPEQTGAGPHEHVFLSSILHTHIGELFSGMKATGCYQFRVTRNSDLFVDAEEVDDLLRALEGELPSRRYGDAVRLEVAGNCPEQFADFLLRRFELGPEDLYRVDGPVNLTRLIATPDLMDRPDLIYPGFTPGLPKGLPPGGDLFNAIAAGDILLHHPFQSFVPVLDFIKQAAADPHVVAIKQTLYRTVPDSTLLETLIQAANAGKEVTVIVELRARFDEETNIGIAEQLQEAGVHVVYGVVGYKTHAKMLLVVRREPAGLRRYVHLGTGNYHQRTARVYTDYGLFTCDAGLGEDVHQIFMQLTTQSKIPGLNRLLQAPFTLLPGLLKRIGREADNACAGRPARIIAKMNGLVDATIIRALYAARSEERRVGKECRARWSPYH